MPFGSTWSEELVAEWLELRGYLTVINLPAGTGSGGGRKQADIVGIKISNDKPEIWHVEIGMLMDNLEKNIERVKSKFSVDIKENVTNYFKTIIPHNIENFTYKMTYVATYFSKPEKIKVSLKEAGIEFMTFHELISQILQDIPKYKTEVPYSSKTSARSLPESWWLLILLDNLRSEKLLKEV